MPLPRSFGLAILAAILTLGWAVGDAQGRSVYLNGVKIDGLTGRTFKNCTVKLDAKGDVHIIAPQYKVQVVPTGVGAAGGARPARPAAAPPTPGRTPTPATAPPAGRRVVGSPPAARYVLVVQRTQKHGSGYALTIKANGVLVTKVLVGEEQRVLDLTPYLKKGSNDISIAASKADATAGGELSLKPFLR